MSMSGKIVTCTLLRRRSMTSAHARASTCRYTDSFNAMQMNTCGYNRLANGVATRQARCKARLDRWIHRDP